MIGRWLCWLTLHRWGAWCEDVDSGYRALAHMCKRCHLVETYYEKVEP